MFLFPQSHDFLTIYDGTQKLDNQTGKLFPATIQSSNSNMTILFKSEGQGKGFEIGVEYIFPGKLINCIE